MKEDERDKYREKLINEKSFFEALCHHLLFIKFQPIIPLGELALKMTTGLQVLSILPTSLYFSKIK
ncbi:MAG: hypothetical protein A3F67_10400 [Verrucomicrobia bacterium RIFCSPHIGHO2_12_FULL_41_10]|nr:MAG: hypothetical protein A3F67_10400 [Verrucomicrobia bacterium RIFCSPHIGHO2_12_FULL_41_10]